MKRGTFGTLIFIGLLLALTVAMVFCRSLSVEAAYPAERAALFFKRQIWSRLVGAWQGSAAVVESRRLRGAAAAAAVQKEELRQLAAENERLRKVLGYAERHVDWLPAAVLSRGGAAAGAHRMLRVARGSLAGVKEGAVVLSPDGLVGRITGVSPHTAEVTLLTDGTVKVACEIEGAPAVSGLLVGGDDQRLILRYLTRASRVPVSARVLTSGLGGVFPKGLVIGTLQDVSRGEKGLEDEGEVRPAVDFSTLEDVFICCEK